MSSRQLRKLRLKQSDLEDAYQQAQEQAQDPANQSETDASDDNDLSSPSRQQSQGRASLFAALGGFNDDENDNDSEEEDPEKEPLAILATDGTKQAADSVEPGANNAKAGENSKKSNNKKKKRKRKKLAGNTQDQDDDAVKPTARSQISEDEIDRALRALRMDAPTAAPLAPLSDQPTVKPSERDNDNNDLFRISSYHLKVINELTSMFGRDTIQFAQTEEQQPSGRRAGGGGLMQVDLETYLQGNPHAPKLHQTSLRRNFFIQGREHWPRDSPHGLTMQEVARDQAHTEYRFAHDKEYESMEFEFQQRAQIGDPMRIVELALRRPYHVLSLIQTSSIAKQDQNESLAAELCEKALFSFGRVTTSAFRQDLERGRARLDFRRPENRPFWLTSYRYIKSLVRKGTYRTALEWAKLLYALDSRDPYGIMQFIPVLAVRARELEWLLAFLGSEEKFEGNPETEYALQTRVLARLLLGDRDGAEKCLRRGLTRLPWFYCSLFRALQIDVPAAIWSAESMHENPFWSLLYLHLAKGLWDNPLAIGLLRTTAAAARPDPSQAADPHLGTIGLGIARLVVLEGETLLISHVPRELLSREPNYEFDPLPPPESENIFTTEASRVLFETTQGGSGSGPNGGYAERFAERIAGMRLWLADEVARDGGGDGDVDWMPDQLDELPARRRWEPDMPDAMDLGPPLNPHERTDGNGNGDDINEDNDGVPRATTRLRPGTVPSRPSDEEGWDGILGLFRAQFWYLYSDRPSGRESDDRGESEREIADEDGDMGGDEAGRIMNMPGSWLDEEHEVGPATGNDDSDSDGDGEQSHETS